MWSLDTGNKDNFYKPYYIEQSQSCSKLKRKHPKNNLEVAVNVKKKKFSEIYKRLPINNNSVSIRIQYFWQMESQTPVFPMIIIW